MRLKVEDIERLNKEVEEAEIRALKRMHERDTEVETAFRRLMNREVRELKKDMYWGVRD